MKRKSVFTIACAVAACTGLLSLSACAEKEQPSLPQFEPSEAATCTTDGHTAYWIKDGKYYGNEQCTDEITLADTVIRALGHDFENGGYTGDGSRHWKVCARENCSVGDTEHKTDCSGGEATCTTKAVCSTCEREYGDVDASNHKGETEVRNASASLCETLGYTGDIYCLDCEELISEGDTLPVLGHDFESGDYTSDGSRHWRVCARENCAVESAHEDHVYNDGVCGLCEYECVDHIDEGDNGACDICGKEVSYSAYFTVGEEKYTPYKSSGLAQGMSAEFSDNGLRLELDGVSIAEPVSVHGCAAEIICAADSENSVGDITVANGNLKLGGTGVLSLSGNISVSGSAVIGAVQLRITGDGTKDNFRTDGSVTLLDGASVALNCTDDTTSMSGIVSSGLTVSNGASLSVTGYKFDIYMYGDVVIENGATVTLGKANDVGIGSNNNLSLTVNGTLNVTEARSHAVYFQTGGGTLNVSGTLAADGLSVFSRTVNVSGGAVTIGKIGGYRLNVTGGSVTVNGNAELKDQNNSGQFVLDGADAAVTVNGSINIYGDNTDEQRCKLRQGTLTARSISAANIVIGDASAGCAASVTVNAGGDAISISPISQKNATYNFEKGSLTVVKTGEQNKSTAFCLNQGGNAVIDIGAAMTVDLTGHQYSFGSWNTNGTLTVNNGGSVTIHSSMITNNTVWTGNEIQNEIQEV